MKSPKYLDKHKYNLLIICNIIFIHTGSFALVYYNVYNDSYAMESFKKRIIYVR
jgi:hypothetical protein